MKENSIKLEKRIEMYVDGASRGNPGPSAYAFILIKEKVGEIHQGYGYIGNQTNNIAEYTAIINGLKVAVKFTTEVLKVYSDSALVVKQLNKQYQVKARHISVLYAEVIKLIKNFKSVEIMHVKRNHQYIKKCDYLCNKCLDEQNIKS
ncbi:MAG: ribonuclease HI family protein [Candidatus Lokiarchaeota archaeon]|nr:ribonuclease HI family protein [Candidatus Lokiarchaeota archaeon]